MVNTGESKQDPSRHFGFNQVKARSSTSLVPNGAKRLLPKKALAVPSRHLSRKDLFYGPSRNIQRNGQPLHVLKKIQNRNSKVQILKKNTSKVPSSSDSILSNMHPEQVQLSNPVGAIMEEKIIKPQDVVEEEIDVEEVDNLKGGGNEANGNGVSHKENGNTWHVAVEKNEEVIEEKIPNDSNGAESKPVIRLKSSRRNSTSSRSSSVSSAPSLKHQQTPVALQMEVSMDTDDRDYMEPLIIEGNAEDLEVSMSASHDEGDDGATTDSEAVAEQPLDPSDSEEDFEGGQVHDSDILLKKAKSQRSNKSGKGVKSSPKPKATKIKTPRSKSAKTKGLSSPKLTAKLLEDFDNYSDTNSLSKDDTESEDLNVKPQKSPSRRNKSSPTKLDIIDEGEGERDGKIGAEHGPRRSSRPRQTPQKYNSSLYGEWEHQLLSEDRINNSDVYGASIRSVKGRRSLRKSRNISSLNSSLHNESSPWDTDFKVLTPGVGGVSAHEALVSDVDSSTPLKRKAMGDADEEEDEDIERGQKKMCVENVGLDSSNSSHTSSFFSVITSPIALLKSKFRGSSVSSSTPIKGTQEPVDIEPVLSAGVDVETKSIDNPTEPAEAVEAAETPLQNPLPGDAVPEAKSWCSIM